jgi:dihydrodipicolinate synthase/N-acetylneuraminate lyase
MKTTPVTFDDLARSVIAVPPLARGADLALDRDENRKMIRHLEAGGVASITYGGNANFYNIALSEYASVLEFLAGAVAPQTWLLPSAGPDFGKMMDQAPIVRALGFPTVMVLPLSFPARPAGVATGLRRFAEACGRPIVLYMKNEGYLDVDHVKRLVDDGLVCAIKYAIVRDDPARDPVLERLVDAIDRRRIVSGIGERPAIVHWRQFGLHAFTSGSVSVAPRASMRLLAALKAGDDAHAEAIRARFLPLEDQRDAHGPIPVLHEAVTLAGVADMGPALPLLANLDDTLKPAVAEAARNLLAFERTLDTAAA